jgi:hypothetical protein
MTELNDLLKNFYVEYNTILPFSKMEVSFTPFKVKDSKNISLILQENNKKLSLKALVEVIKNNSKNCDIYNLCLADAEYLFLMIRSKSVEESINLNFKNKPLNLNLYDIKFRNDIVNKDINFQNGCSIKIKTPVIKDLLDCDDLDKKSIFKKSIKSVTLNKETFYIEKYLPKDLENFIEEMPISLVTEIEKLKHPELYFTLPDSCGEGEVSGILSFFTYR